MKDPAKKTTRTTRSPKLLVSQPATQIKAEDIWPPVTEEELKFCEGPKVARGIYRVPGDSAWFRGSKDAHRYYERSKREIATGSILNNRHFNTAGTTVMVTGSTQWQFVFGRDEKGGGGGKGKGGASGGGDSQDGVEVEVDIKDHPLFKNLELPNLERKKTARTEVVGVRLAGLDKTGTRSDWARKDSIKHAIKRITAAMNADPTLLPGEDDDYLVPQEFFIARSDNRYWTYDETRQPIIEATAYLLCDKSGSITAKMFEMMYLFCWCCVTFLEMNYKGIKIIILGHTDGAPIQFTSWEAMTKDRTTGGTTISPSLRWIREHAQQNNPPSKVNCYLIQGGDGDNSSSDNDNCRRAYIDLINDGFNHIVWEETMGDNSPSIGFGSGPRDSDHTILMRQLAASHPRMFHVGKLKDRESVFAEFRLAYKKRGGKVA